MNLKELNDYLNAILKKENFLSDPSRNGIQIENSNPSKKIKKIAFAVDACEATALACAKINADVLVVHHGLFWGDCTPLTGSHFKRCAAFIKNDVALIAYHIPLDANAEVGNNYGMAFRLNMTNLQPFGYWRGMPIGVKGQLEKPMTLEEIGNKVLRTGKKPGTILNFGKKEIKTIGIISGGASEDVEQAVEEQLDAYITGEFAHEQFHYAEEMKINVIGGGHYETETFGVSLLKEKIDREIARNQGIETVFIDLPTGL